ncbi:hypothetical protein [Streptomyces sp. sk2.1]|uniref:hypothetical protein n=1 Tax=Streptomyces sp. sk2.1 TaxID=2478959 RepID=UPI0011E72762|nr:hypothetical protein [Streptomyces sp. sk2.1]
MNAPMTPDAALTRLRQYGERTSTWSTATYNDGVEKALHEIALALAAEVDRLKRSAVLAEEDYQRIVRGACQVESQLRARVAELEAAQHCPSQMTTSLGTSQCALPVRHQGDHRNAAKNHFWSDDYADATRIRPPGEATTT